MNNSTIPPRQAHWLQVKTGLAEARATNGIGWAVHTMPGRKQIGQLRDTTAGALADLARMDNGIDEDLGVYECLSERVAA